MIQNRVQGCGRKSAKIPATCAVFPAPRPGEFRLASRYGLPRVPVFPVPTPGTNQPHFPAIDCPSSRYITFHHDLDSRDTSPTHANRMGNLAASASPDPGRDRPRQGQRWVPEARSPQCRPSACARADSADGMAISSLRPALPSVSRFQPGRRQRGGSLRASLLTCHQDCWQTTWLV
jgi:hypothetical protein